MINCPWFCMASYSFRSSSDSSTSWMTTVRGGSLTSGLPSFSSDFSRLMETCLRSFCKRLWAKKSVNVLSTPVLERGPQLYVVIRTKRRSNRLQGKVRYFSVILRPWVLVRWSWLSSPRPPVQQSYALPTDLILLRLNEPKFESKENYAYLGKQGKNKYKYKGVVVQSTRPTASWVEIHQISQNKACKKVYESTCKKKKTCKSLKTDRKMSTCPYMAESAGGQDEANPAFWVATPLPQSTKNTREKCKKGGEMEGDILTIIYAWTSKDAILHLDQTPT